MFYTQSEDLCMLKTGPAGIVTHLCQSVRDEGV